MSAFCWLSTTSSCEVAAVTKISPGDRFGHWTVLAPAPSRPCYFSCRCDCGSVKDVYRSSLLQGTSTCCPSCSHRTPSGARQGCSKAALVAAKKKYTGTTVSGWQILDVLPSSGSRRGLRCRAVCPVCGRPTITALGRITASKPIRRCSGCSHDISKPSGALHAVAYTDGSSLASVRKRLDGTINKNSSTGVNGVTLRPDGRYHAYINFKRKQLYLGSYPDLAAAAAARKKAEAEIYGEYLDQHEGWEEELKEKLKDKK